MRLNMQQSAAECINCLYRMQRQIARDASLRRFTPDHLWANSIDTPNCQERAPKLILTTHSRVNEKGGRPDAQKKGPQRMVSAGTESRR